MPRKLSKEALAYREGVRSFNAWMKDNKKLEKMGLYGTDYYVRRVEELEAKVKRLEARLKTKGKK
jgi:hypothetical protein|tara:strand:- start:29 stop:223 length:195 start_codon:yes stop_codon:yes gene_type:complete